jgi:hypothetical protein
MPATGGGIAVQGWRPGDGKPGTWLVLAHHRATSGWARIMASLFNQYGRGIVQCFNHFFFTAATGA